MKQKRIFGILALSMVFVLGVSMVSAFNFGERFGNGNGLEFRENNEERDQMREFILQDDYQSWENLIGHSNRASEDKFVHMREKQMAREEFRNAVQEARAEEDFEKLQELKSQFGHGRGIRQRNTNYNGCS